MEGSRHNFLLICMVAVAIPVSLAFNIDMTDPVVHHGEQKDFYGYKVLQFRSGSNKGIIITAPLKQNGSGEVCNPEITQCFSSPGISYKDKIIPVKHLGLSVAVDPISPQFTVCSPSLAHECNGSSYVNSACYEVTNHFDKNASFTPGFKECTKKKVDLVFLFDGSLSMTGDEFKKNKDFIVDIMKSLKGTSIKFAAAQFSTDYRKVFDFNDYQAGRALDKLKRERHMRSLTNTHKALELVLKDILINPNAGESPDATKVLVLITDGDPSDEDTVRIIEKYDDMNIIRFVIGVKDVQLDKFTDIASKPTDKYAFKIESYTELKGVLETFQTKIFKMEGSKAARAGDITDEMSQSGFSAVFSKDTLVLGSVGSDSWRGSLMELKNKKKVKEIRDPTMAADSYMGYSIAVGQKNNAPLYFTGAPRHNHTGQVILFKKHKGNDWKLGERLNGDQIGSYFGAELCSVDINSDGNTDFLLVGAPLFYQPQEKTEGQIYIYRVTDEMQLRREFNVTALSMGRFGTTISSLADLNGDGLRDIAVGAPLEDDNRGAVYIYLGDIQKGIRSTFNQKIMGKKIKSSGKDSFSLRFFGQSIDGGFDLGDDELPDIVIGSQGAVVVLRSKPVFNVTARLSFQPAAISTDGIACLGKKDGTVPMVNLTACFKAVEVTKSKAGEASSRLNISFMLNVDPTRTQTSRGFFGIDKNARSLTSTYELMKDKETCLIYSINMPKCVTDTLSPISIKLNFVQVDSENAGAVLNVDDKNQAVTEVPFEKQCVKNDTCIADLEVDFDFMMPTLLVAEDNYFNVTVALFNKGDDSYNTSLTVYHPPGISYMNSEIIKESRPILHRCDTVYDRTFCRISLPVYRSKTYGKFKFIFYVSTLNDWNDTMSMSFSGNSENANTTGVVSSMSKSIPVQFQIKMAVTLKEDKTTTYLNYTTEDDSPKKMEIRYKITNPGWKAFPVNVSLPFPTKLEYDFELQDYLVAVQQNKTQCHVVDKSTSCPPEQQCKAIVCDTFILDKESDTEFIFSGNIQFRHLKELEENLDFLKKYTGKRMDIKFRSSIHVSYDKQQYVLESQKREEKSHDIDPTMKMIEVQVELIIPPNKLRIISTGVGTGLFLLIIITCSMFKVGFFKRKTFPEKEESTDAVIDYGLTTPLANGEVGTPVLMKKTEEGVVVTPATSSKRKTFPEQEESTDAVIDYGLATPLANWEVGTPVLIKKTEEGVVVTPATSSKESKFPEEEDKTVNKTEQRPETKKLLKKGKGKSSPTYDWPY